VSFLKKAFATVAQRIGLKKAFTPRGMRRTFNDLMRLAKVEAIVTKSISGHQTDRMRELYSTVTPDEQRRSIHNVLQLFGPRPTQRGGEASPKSGPKVGRVPERVGRDRKIRGRVLRWTAHGQHEHLGDGPAAERLVPRMLSYEA
jgi:hypothetical protein